MNRQNARHKNGLCSILLFTSSWLSCCWMCPGSESVQAGDQAVSFANDVIPILTKAGCNGGACHAKSGGGQNGFQLSLFGFEPQEDYEYLTKQARGRRFNVAAPEKSLVLRKGSGQIAHGGGVRLKKDSAAYATLREWIRQGLPADREGTPTLVSFSVEPQKTTFQPHQEQQLRGIARYSNGEERDVTSLTLFESNEKSMADASADGLVKASDISGKVAIMARYQGHVAMFTAVIPMGAPVSDLPPSKNFIDDLIFSNLKELGIPASPVCDDSTFLRRVTLDIAGRLPTEAETQAFLTSGAPDKRDLVIDDLLRTPDYADYFAAKWTALLKNRRDDTSDLISNFAFHAWVRDSLLANKPYDQFVREILAATGTVIGNPPVAWYKRVKDPKNQIEDVAQLFLGVRMQCAQCHHHPFEKWSQDDYYSLSAFFTQVGRKPSSTRGEDLIFHKRGTAMATNVRSGKSLTPAALGDVIPPIKPDEDPRLKLADWMGAPSNPFFAKVLVNRYWKHFFQRGLVEPEDDIRDSNPASNPELLAALEKHFVESHFDLKQLVRVITQSQAYQLGAIPNAQNIKDRQNYSHFYTRRLPAEVLLDSIDQVAGTRTDFGNLPSGTRAIALPDNSYNRSSAFLRVFGRPEGESVCECERVQTSSLAQSLHLINASDVKAKLADGNGRVELLLKDTRPVEEKVRELYRAALSREPRSEELQTAVSYLNSIPVGTDGNPIDAQRAARENLQDLMWALINTKEFLFNH